MGRSWKGLIAANLALLVGLISMIPGILQREGRNPWAVGALILAFVGFIFIVWLEVSDYRARQGRLYTKDEADTYLRNWMKQGGRVAVFTRDATWAESPAMKDLLISKAKRGELTLCVAHKNQHVREIEKDGAAVIVLRDTPRSRFTIVRHGRQDAEVAIALSSKGKFQIEEFSSSSHAFGVAEDLVAIVTSYESLQQRKRETP